MHATGSESPVPLGESPGTTAGADAGTRAVANRETSAESVPRLRLDELLRGARAIEIDHKGKIYRLQLNRANKLLLTA